MECATRTALVIAQTNQRDKVVALIRAAIQSTIGLLRTTVPDSEPLRVLWHRTVAKLELILSSRENKKIRDYVEGAPNATPNEDSIVEAYTLIHSEAYSQNIGDGRHPLVFTTFFLPLCCVCQLPNSVAAENSDTRVAVSFTTAMRMVAFSMLDELIGQTVGVAFVCVKSINAALIAEVFTNAKVDKQGRRRRDRAQRERCRGRVRTSRQAVARVLRCVNKSA